MQRTCGLKLKLLALSYFLADYPHIIASFPKHRLCLGLALFISLLIFMIRI